MPFSFFSGDKFRILNACNFGECTGLFLARLFQSVFMKPLGIFCTLLLR